MCCHLWACILVPVQNGVVEDASPWLQELDALSNSAVLFNTKLKHQRFLSSYQYFVLTRRRKPRDQKKKKKILALMHFLCVIMFVLAVFHCMLPCSIVWRFRITSSTPFLHELKILGWVVPLLQPPSPVAQGLMFRTASNPYGLQSFFMYNSSCTCLLDWCEKCKPI